MRRRRDGGVVITTVETNGVALRVELFGEAAAPLAATAIPVAAVGEVAMGMIELWAVPIGGYYGLDERFRTTNGRSHRC